MKPSTLDIFSLSKFYQGSVSIVLLRESTDRVFHLGLREFPGLEVDEVVLQDSCNVKAVSAGILLAGLLKDYNSRGITNLAVGVGPGAYDIGDPPTVVSNTRLVSEVSRADVLFTNFVDGSGNPTLEKTNTVDLNFQFGFSEAIATLKEMALFGGEGAGVANGGLITNYKVFTPFAKPNNRIMFVTWRIRFNI